MSRRKKIIIAMLFMGVMLAVVMTRLVNSNAGYLCLDDADYKDLTQNAMPNTNNPKSNFYSFVVEFPGTVAATPEVLQITNKIASFYRDHADKSIHINLSGINQDPTTAEVADKRLETFVDQLKRGGVAPSDIKSSSPQFYELDSNYAGIVTATIVTGQECQ